jgi:hypothetical protein
MNLLLAILLSQWTLTPDYKPIEFRIMEHCWGVEYIDLQELDYSFENRLRLTIKYK